MKIQFRGYLVTLLLLLGMIASARSATIRTVLDRDSIVSGEVTELKIVVQNGNPQSAENFPAVPGLNIQYRGQQQRMTSINGQTTFSIILTYAVTGTQPGDYTIPSIRVVVDGATYSTEPVKLSVSKGNPQMRNRRAFLTLKVPRQDIYVGEIIPIDLQLYVTGADDIQAPQIKSDGFIIHKEPPNTQSKVQIGNNFYTVLDFKKSISAAKAGDLQLGPAEMSLNIVQPDPNDPFSFFTGGRRTAVKLASESFKMHVLPLPPKAPASFSGAIGKFSWSVEASPKTVNAGDPITLKITISGAGNLDAISLADFNGPDFKTYQPTTDTETQDPLGLSGSKKFEMAIIPQNSGVHAIPEQLWSYFDPVARQYQTLRQEPIPITVNATIGGQPAPSVVTGKAPDTEEAEHRRDIVHIKSSPGHLATIALPLARQPWFVAIQALPLLGFLGVTIWRKRKDKLENNPRLRRRIETRKTVHDGLQHLQSLASANQAEEFYALLFRLLQEELGERLDLPASAITEAVLNERLPARGASRELITRLHHLFGICNQARYAPVRTNEQLMNIQVETTAALRELQSLPD
jgi:hypothetical protein